MNTIDTNLTLARLVDERPSLAHDFERLGFDYCCGGTATLADACAAQGLECDAVAAQLTVTSEGDEPAEWSRMGMIELVDHILDTHHRYLWEEMPRLQALAAKVADVHGDRHPELADVLRGVQAIRADMQMHLTKEEQVLFPMIRELASSDAIPKFHCGTLANPISVMMREHDNAGVLLEHLTVLSDDFTVPADGCASYRALYAGLRELVLDTHLHVHKENHRLFPMVLDAERSATAR